VLAAVPLVLSVRRGLARRPVHPHPDLLRLRPIHEDEEALFGVSRHLPIDLAADVARRDEPVRARRDSEHLRALLLRNWLQRVEVAVHLDAGHALAEVVPANLDEGVREVEVLESDAEVAVGHRYQVRRPREQMMRGSPSPLSSWTTTRRSSSWSETTSSARSSSWMPARSWVLSLS